MTSEQGFYPLFDELQSIYWSLFNMFVLENSLQSIHDAVMWGQVRTRRANIIGGSYIGNWKTQHVSSYGWLFSEIVWIGHVDPTSSSWRALQVDCVILINAASRIRKSFIHRNYEKLRRRQREKQKECIIYNIDKKNWYRFYWF